MGMTIAEKIIAAAAGVESVKPGDIHTVELDRLMSNDGTTHLTVDMYNNKLKNPHIADTSKLVFIVDHNVPSDCPKTPGLYPSSGQNLELSGVSISSPRTTLPFSSRPNSNLVSAMIIPLESAYSAHFL